MSSTFLDAGDMQRLDRERNLVKTAPRQLSEEPIDGIENWQHESKPENLYDFILDGLMAALKRRLS